jgi:glycyl-tRNA synthetase beta chain
MKKNEDFLVEIHTEELPPKTLLKLGQAFCQHIQERLQKAELNFAGLQFFAAPRRLAVLVKQLAASQPAQIIERKGPALSAAFDAQGNPSPACMGFARSCGVAASELKTIKTAQGEWVGMTQTVPGKSLEEVLPALVEQALAALPIPKRMRWGDNETQFTRPIHSVMMLYGDRIIEGTVLGYAADRMTRGHRFHAPDWQAIHHAAEYESFMQEKAYVMADFEKRRDEIVRAANACVEASFHGKASVLIDENLLDEVTGLVEWPVALVGNFDSAFLSLPPEVLISAMQDHQRYFPVIELSNNSNNNQHNKNIKLLPHFVTISNIKSKNPQQVVQGNERVLRARLSDAAFFYDADKKENLTARIERLKGIVFQAKLGSLYDKAERLSKLAALIAQKTQVDVQEAKLLGIAGAEQAASAKLSSRSLTAGSLIDEAEQAGILAKTDLTTNMVGEFPELQGVMGFYYAQHEGLSHEIALAMKEQYLPRFAGDDLPASAIGQALALADRIDTLVGTFGINQIPTGDKDPYGLRRAALGIVRILIEKNISLDLKEIVEAAINNYTVKLENPDIAAQVLNFIQERLRSWYQDQGVAADVFASVSALNIFNPVNIHARIKAVQTFKKLAEAEALSIANKRVSNILAKYADAIEAKKINSTLFENAAEQELARQLEVKNKLVSQLSESGKYDEVLLQLADLRKPVDDFFDQVMVMAEDKPRRENRILLLSQLRALFLQVADIALLQ